MVERVEEIGELAASLNADILDAALHPDLQLEMVLKHRQWLHNIQELVLQEIEDTYWIEADIRKLQASTPPMS